MSFTIDIIDELVELGNEKTCCRKALLFGLFFGAQRVEKKLVLAEFKTENSAMLAVKVLKRQFSAEPECFEVNRAGKRFFCVRVNSRPIANYIDDISLEVQEEAKNLSDIIGFRCPSCTRAFLSGAFISSGVAIEPEKRYSLEFSVKGEGRAELLSRLLCLNVGAPGCVDRRGRIGLYYKENELISDILSYMGASKAAYRVINAYVGHAIKNQENRATNCVLSNIKKSVSAIRRQIDAIEKIKATGRFERLEEELKYTANLRCEYDSASLSELAALHEPSISKSGLNKRLERIMTFADEE